MNETVEPRLTRALRDTLDTDTGVRLRAVPDLKGCLPDVRAFDRLVAMLDDENVSVWVEAAEALVLRGGDGGVRVVYTEIGKRADDSDFDYVGYRMIDLENMEIGNVLSRARAIHAQLDRSTDIARWMAHAIADIERNVGPVP